VPIGLFSSFEPFGQGRLEHRPALFLRHALTILRAVHGLAEDQERSSRSSCCSTTGPSVGLPSHFVPARGSLRPDGVGARGPWCELRLVEEILVGGVVADGCVGPRLFGGGMAELHAVRRCGGDDECPFKTVGPEWPRARAARTGSPAESGVGSRQANCPRANTRFVTSSECPRFHSAYTAVLSAWV
jgi:hypothetical protein